MPMDKWINNGGMSIDYSAIKRNRYNMDKFSKLYAEEKKLDIEDYVTYESIYMKFNYRQN